MRKRIKDLVPGELVKLDTGTERVKRIISDTPNYPEWRIQWAGLSGDSIVRVDFLPTEWVTVILEYGESDCDKQKGRN